MSGVRLFGAFRGPHWTLPALGTDDVPAPEAALRMVCGPAHRSYGEGLFLIRPDGHVGWAGDTPAGLAEYRARFTGR